MVDYNKATGTAGTLRISDNGSTVSFVILCSDGATNVGSLSWTGTVNGVAVGGTVSLPAGFGSRTVGSWPVSSAQTVHFNIGASGTQGLGGPTNHSAAIARAGVPPAPTPLPSTPDQITATSMRYQFQGNGSGGSPILRWEVLYGTDPATMEQDGTLITSSGTSIIEGLLPGTKYYFKSRGINALGGSPWSSIVSGTTLTGARVSDGTSWKPAQVLVSDGTSWKPAQVLVSDGTSWKPAG